MFKILNHSHLESIVNAIQCHAAEIGEHAHYKLLQDTNLRKLENNDTSKRFEHNLMCTTKSNFHLISSICTWEAVIQIWILSPTPRPTKTDIFFEV
jgi:hypothetical protein